MKNKVLNLQEQQYQLVQQNTIENIVHHRHCLEIKISTIGLHKIVIIEQITTTTLNLSSNIKSGNKIEKIINVIIVDDNQIISKILIDLIKFLKFSFFIFSIIAHK